MAASLFDLVSSVTPSTLSVPVGIQAGDLAVVFDNALQATTPPTSVYPTTEGFTPLGTSQSVTGGGFGLRFNMSFKELLGTETSLSVMAGSSATAKWAIVFRLPEGQRWGTPILAGQATTFSTPVNQTIVPAGGQGVFVAFGDDLGVGGATALVMNPAGTYGTIGSSRAGYLVSDAGPVNNTVSASGSFGTLGSLFLPYYSLRRPPVGGRQAVNRAATY